MNSKILLSALIAIAMPLAAATAEKPRVFITESQSVQLSGDAAAGDAKGAVSATGGASPQSVEVIKSFSRRCPNVIVTASRDKADYVVRFDHEAISPTTPFVHGNKVAVFNKKEDLIYSDTTRMLGNAVKGACAAITASPRN